MKLHIHFLPILLFFSTALLAQPGAGYMLDCNGSSSYANCGTINLSGSQITLETWINVDAFKTGSPYISSIMGTEQTGNQAGLRFGDAGLAANKVQFVLLFGSTHVKLNGNMTLSTDRWYHIAATYDGTGMKIYINGVLDASNTQTGSFTSNSTFELARNYDNSRSLDGFIDEPSVFNTALSQSTIRDWMCKKMNSSHPNYANLVGYWPLDEGTGSSSDDMSGNGYDVSLSGSPSWEYSGAPVGDASKYVYASTFNIGISSAQGDSINYEHLNGITQGAHVYRIDSVPYNTSTPNPIIHFDTTHYWGVFTLGNASYETSYFYDGNSYLGTGNDCFIGMGERLDAYEEDWNNQGFTSVNYSSEVVTWTDSIRSENILGLSANGPHTFTFDNDQPTCFEDNDGSITVHVSGGESPYSYAWAGGSNDSTATNLVSGYHVFTVTDNNSCVSTDSFFLNEPMLVLGTIAVTDASCALSADGSMTVTPNGGSNSGYTYLWNNQNNSTTATVSNLGVGSFSVTITDNEGCEGEAMASLSSIGPDPIPNLGPDTNVCGETTWGLTASVTNGPATAFNWSSGETGPIKIVTMTGKYSLTVTNNAGCEGLDTIDVTYVDPIQVELPNNGNGTGDYDIEASEGFLFYEWSTSETGQTITVTTSGLYSVKATDSNGCQSSDTIDVTITPAGFDNLNENFTHRIWPNPVKDVININRAKPENIEFTILDLRGSQILRKELTSGLENSLNIDHLADGMYFIRFTSENQSKTQTFIKSH
jgi:hypothetical protein